LTTAVGSGLEALAALNAERFDCMVLDLSLPDLNGFEVLGENNKATRWSELPIIIYTAGDLTKKEETQLKRVAQSIVLKDVRSPERLLDETALFLHRVVANLPSNQRRMLEELHQTDVVLAGKKILIVDDDIRNIF